MKPTKYIRCIYFDLYDALVVKKFILRFNPCISGIIVLKYNIFFYSFSFKPSFNMKYLIVIEIISMYNFANLGIIGVTPCTICCQYSESAL